MSLRPDADDLHVAPPRVRADDAFLAQLAAVSAASTARERRRAERHSGLRVAFASASVAVVVAGGMFTAGNLMGSAPASGHRTPPAERPHDRDSADVEDPAGGAVAPTADPDAGPGTVPGTDSEESPEPAPEAYVDDGDGAADRDDDLPTVPHSATPVRPGNQAGRDDRPDGTTPPADDATPPQGEPPADGDASRPPPQSPAPAPAPDPNDPGTDNPGDPEDDDQGEDPEGDPAGDPGGDDGQGDDDWGGNGDHSGDLNGATADRGWCHSRGHGRAHGRHGRHHGAPRPAAPPRGA